MLISELLSRQQQLITGAAAELAAARKMAKYSNLSDQYSFCPVAAETQRPLNEMAYEVVGNLGRCIARLYDDKRESSYFCSSICLWWCNALVQFCCSTVFLVHDHPDQWSLWLDTLCNF